MKLKYALAVSLAVASFAGALVSTQARADIYPGRECLLACYQEYNLCMTYTPEKEHLCRQRRWECLSDCGTFL